MLIQIERWWRTYVLRQRPYTPPSFPGWDPQLPQDESEDRNRPLPPEEMLQAIREAAEKANRERATACQYHNHRFDNSRPWSGHISYDSKGRPWIR